MHPAVFALGIPALLGLIAFLYFKVTMEGPNATIVVVDRRTMRLAQRRIAEARASGRLMRASHGLTALIVWLDGQIKTGPQKYRVQYASLKEQAELDRAQISESTGWPTPII
jgi:hypothetical protein